MAIGEDWEPKEVQQNVFDVVICVRVWAGVGVMWL